VSIETLYRGVRRMVEALSRDADRMRQAEAWLAHNR
jgi:hypothetical protein